LVGNSYNVGCWFFNSMAIQLLATKEIWNKLSLKF